MKCTWSSAAWPRHGPSNRPPSDLPPWAPRRSILTKLDEANGLGNVLPLVRSSGLPVSYLTDGQNVPDDIQTADARRLAQMILGVDPSDERSAVVS